MNDIEKNNLFYVCSLIEFIGRKTKNKRSSIVELLGKKELDRQLDLAEVNHCLSYEQVSDEIIEYFNIPVGDFDSVGLCKYNVPSVQFKVFKSFISDEISDFNSSVYYSNPEYLKYSYLEGKLLD